MRKRLIFFFVTAVLILNISSVGFAQRQTGSIKGTVSDEGGEPLPGVTVIISSPSMQGKQTFITTPKGDYRFPSCPPGEYSVRAEISGFGTIERTGVIVAVGVTVDANIQMKPSSVEEEVTVIAANPVVDAEAHGVSVTMTAELIKAAPLRRDIVDIYRTAPGTVGEDESQDYRKSAAVHGGALHDSKISMDGVDLVDPSRGYISGDVAFDAIEEVEISIAGHKAEVGGVTAGFVNVVSKSGGNKLSGGLTLAGTTKDFVSNIIPKEQLIAAGLKQPIFYNYKFDAGVKLGGPLIKDKVWWFISPRFTDKEKNTEFVPFTDPDGIEHPAYNYRRREYVALGKVTTQISQKIKLMGMYQYNYFKDLPSAWGGGRYQPVERCVNWFDSSHTVSSILSYVFDQNTFIEARFGLVNRYLNAARRETPEGPASRGAVDDRLTGYTWGDGGVGEHYNRDIMDISLAFTRFQDQLLGMSHEFKLGLNYANALIKDQNPRPIPYAKFVRGASPYYYGDVSPYRGRVDIRAGEQGLDLSPHSYGFWRLSAYLQDSLSVGKRLTVNLGLRYDENHGFRKADTYKGWTDTLYNGLANVLLPSIFPTQDLTSPEMKNVIVYRILQPRIGFNYDLFGNGKTAIKGSFSRYAESFLGGNVSSFLSFSPRVVSFTWNDNNRNGTFDLPPVDSYTAGSYSSYVTDPAEIKKQVVDNLSAPYFDEFTIGVAHELTKDFGITLDFMYKEGKNLVGRENLVNPKEGSMWIPYTAKDPGGDRKYGTGDDQDLTVYMLDKNAGGDFLRKRNLPDASKKYWGFDLIFFKRMSNNWQFQGSVTYSKQYGNYSAAYMSNTGTENWWNPNVFINKNGRLDNDRPLIIKLMSTVVLPLNITVSAYYRYLTGSPWGRNVTVYFPSSINGVLPKSPSVQVRAEPIGSRKNIPESVMDVRVEKDFKLGPGRLGVWIEAFNLFGFYSWTFIQDPGGYIYPNGTFLPYERYGAATAATGNRTINFALRYNF